MPGNLIWNDTLVNKIVLKTTVSERLFRSNARADKCNGSTKIYSKGQGVHHKYDNFKISEF